MLLSCLISHARIFRPKIKNKGARGSLWRTLRSVQKIICIETVIHIYIYIYIHLLNFFQILNRKSWAKDSYAFFFLSTKIIVLFFHFQTFLGGPHCIKQRSSSHKSILVVMNNFGEKRLEPLSKASKNICWWDRAPILDETFILILFPKIITNTRLWEEQSWSWTWEKCNESMKWFSKRFPNGN